MTDPTIDPFSPRLALRAPAGLAPFNRAGVLSAADVHVARRLGELGGDEDPHVVLAAALAVRGPRLGSIFVDLATVRSTATSESDEPVGADDLAWPEVAEWVAAVERSPLVTVGEADGSSSRPLRLVGTRLYLDRYWSEEIRVAADLRRLSAAPPPPVDSAALAASIRRLFPAEPDGAQARASRGGVERRFSVIAGGPGTGKTTTVARLLALIFEQDPTALVALAAPTGKAADRLGEAVHAAAESLPVTDPVRAALFGSQASTLHRLLGPRRDSHSRFRHHGGNRLPHDVVIVDETSMVSLSMMARLAEAVRTDARLVLVGDPGQLTSVEAGAVLGDIVGPGSAPGIVVLDRGHRFGAAITELATAVRAGDPDAVVAALRAGGDGLTWIEADPDDAAAVIPVRARAVAAARTVIEAARAGDAPAALEALAGFRVLCAHRRGPHGASTWMSRIERWLAAEVAGFEGERGWYAGRPLLVTENDYGLGLFNGDTGVVVAEPDGSLSAAFERRGELLRLRPSRLHAVDTVHAMTVHKAQGSEFAEVAVLLPPADSKILTRELLYTAVTRASDSLVVVGTEAAVRAGVARPVARATGLRERLEDR